MGTPFCIDAKFSEVIQLSLLNNGLLWKLHYWDIFKEMNSNRVVIWLQMKGQLDYDGTSLSSVSWNLTRAAWKSSLRYYLLFWVCLCHEMFFTARQVWSLMSTARASEPHQAGISKLLSWVFRKGKTKDKGRLLATCPFSSPFEVS